MNKVSNYQKVIKPHGRIIPKNPATIANYLYDYSYYQTQYHRLVDMPEWIDHKTLGLEKTQECGVVNLLNDLKLAMGIEWTYPRPTVGSFEYFDISCGGETLCLHPQSIRWSLVDCDPVEELLLGQFSTFDSSTMHPEIDLINCLYEKKYFPYVQTAVAGCYQHDYIYKIGDTKRSKDLEFRNKMNKIFQSM